MYPFFILALAAFMESVQWLIVMSVISQHIPVDSTYYMARAFEKQKVTFGLTRQLWLYRIFILISMGLAAAGVFFFDKKMQEKKFVDAVAQYTVTQAVLIAIQGFAVFKIVSLGSPAWAWGILYTAMVIAILSRIFWVELSKAAATLVKMNTDGQLQGWRWLWDVGIIIIAQVILMMIWPKGVAGLWGCMLYFILFYLLLRIVLNSTMGALLGLFLWMKWSLFYAAFGPSVWLPVMGATRLSLDVPLFLCLAFYIKTQQARFFIAACVLAGASVILGTPTGLILLLALSVYGVGMYGQDKFKIKCGLFLAWGLALFNFKAGFFMLMGGRSDLPIYMPLAQRHFFIFLAALIVPVIYAMTIVLLGALLYLRKGLVQYWLIIALSVYGLGLYWGFMADANPRHYYAVAMPLACVAAFWFKQLLNGCEHLRGAICRS